MSGSERQTLERFLEWQEEAWHWSADMTHWAGSQETWAVLLVSHSVTEQAAETSLGLYLQNGTGLIELI